MNLLQIIEDYHEATGGSCGITTVQLCVKAGIAINSARPVLEELEASGKIERRRGINSTLIYPKTNAK